MPSDWENSCQAFSQSDGRWRFSSNNPESSTYAAGSYLCDENMYLCYASLKCYGLSITKSNLLVHILEYP